jgi:hypothetical protein
MPGEHPPEVNAAFQGEVAERFKARRFGAVHRQVCRRFFNRAIAVVMASASLQSAGRK